MKLTCPCARDGHVSQACFSSSIPNRSERDRKSPEEDALGSTLSRFPLTFSSIKIQWNAYDVCLRSVIGRDSEYGLLHQLQFRMK